MGGGREGGRRERHTEGRREEGEGERGQKGERRIGRGEGQRRETPGDRRGEVRGRETPWGRDGERRRKGESRGRRKRLAWGWGSCEVNTEWRMHTKTDRQRISPCADNRRTYRRTDP